MTAAPARTLLLTERVPRRCRLRRTDAAFLLEHHRTHLDLVPAGGRGLWRVTARGWAGVIVCGRLRLVLRPKVPLDNLFFFLDPTAPVQATRDDVRPEAGDAVLDFLAGQFAVRLAALADRGLHRGYRERQEEGPFLMGRLDVAAQFRQAPAHPDRLHCLHDEFTADVPCNRAVKAVVERLLQSPLPGATVRDFLRAVAARLDEVQAVVPSPEGWERFRQEGLPAEYALLLDMGRLLLDGLAPGAAAGPTPAPAFLIDMERAWERHVTRAVCAALDGGPCVALVQESQVVGRTGAGGAVLMRPDVVVRDEGRPRVVVDAKWKRVGRGGPAAEDLYQVLAYCTALGAPRAVLVYPGRRDAARHIAFAQTPVRVTTCSLRAGGPRQECARSARKLGRWLLRLAG
jgi:5-methylcytosine-specific restriction enzyme subunit McrC